MANHYFQFKQFTIEQQHCAMKVTTDACLFGAWVAEAMTEIRDSMTDEQMPSTEYRTSNPGYRPTANGQRPTVNGQRTSALDIGTGTGLLSLMLAQKTDWAIDAIEIDPAAAEQAGQNFMASPWRHRLQVIKGDITALQLAKQYPIIISNPPFFENQLASPHEGRQKAMHASELSLQSLFTVIATCLTATGTAFLLLPAYRYDELQNLASQQGLYVQAITWVKQTPSHEPFRMMVQLGYVATPLQADELVIREADQQYSAGFVALLKDYYLRM